MPRRGSAKIKQIESDPIYKNVMVAKLINRLMRDGKKSVASRQVYGAFEILNKEKLDPMKVFEGAFENIQPSMEVRARRVGGAAYQVPMQVRGRRKESLAIRWLVATARQRSNSEYHTFSEKLAAELKDAAHGEGGAVKKRQEIERIAEANRAFAHFKW